MITAQTTTTLNEVEQAIKSWLEEHNPKDHIKNLSMHKFAFDQDMKPNLIDFNNEGFVLKEHAYKNLLNKIGIPVDYAKKLSNLNEIGRKLIEFNANVLIQHGQHKNSSLFRMIDGNVIRSIHSDRYESYDCFPLIKDLIPYSEGTVVRRFSFEDDYFNLSLSLPMRGQEVKVGDIIEAGIHVSNSEIGLRSATIAPYIWRRTCSNGMIGKSEDVYRFRHIGNSDRIGELVRSAIEATYQNVTGLVAKMKHSVTRVIESPMDALEQFSKSNNITEADYKDMIDHLLLSGEDNSNLFGLVQSVSHVANAKEGEDACKFQQYSVMLLEQGLNQYN